MFDAIYRREANVALYTRSVVCVKCCLNGGVHRGGWLCDHGFVGYW